VAEPTAQLTAKPAAQLTAVDLDAPLVRQVGGLREGYDAWVHRSIRPGRSLRMFEGAFMEAMSHIPWWLVLVVWVPIGASLVAVSVAWGGLTVGAALARVALGALLWTLFEYVLHRFVFHWQPTTAVGRRFHFVSHGIHHLDPWDPTRLVFPPLAGLVVAILIFGLIWLATPLASALAVMAGVLAGYITYDMTHYFTHHGKPRSRWGKFLKAYHLAHHHKHWDRMFGVSQPLWDVVFRTGRPRAP
jgi:sterol desaturase/sphingolipid hydroxylase (fatty acid hydroxylase superfamily)